MTLDKNVPGTSSEFLAAREILKQSGDGGVALFHGKIMGSLTGSGFESAIGAGVEEEFDEFHDPASSLPRRYLCVWMNIPSQSGGSSFM